MDKKYIFLPPNFCPSSIHYHHIKMLIKHCCCNRTVNLPLIKMSKLNVSRIQLHIDNVGPFYFKTILGIANRISSSANNSF